MSSEDKKRPANDGWSPKPLKEGYQPAIQLPLPKPSEEDGGYQPVSKGDGPASDAPPGDE